MGAALPRSESAGGLAEQPGSAAAVGGAERVGRVLKYPSHQRLARVRGQARFALLTPRCAGWDRADGGAPNFFCGSGTDGICFTQFFAPNPQTGGYFADWGDLRGLLELL
jgi:hypothetical protein